MSIQPINDEEEVAATEGDANLPLYVPDGNYDVPAELPEGDEEHDKSTSTINLFEEAGEDPINIAVFPSLSSSNDSPNSPITAVADSKLCGVCKEKEMKYKCSRCYLPYCSIACSTLHKATHPLPPPPITKPEPALPSRPAPTTALAGTAAFAHLTSPFAPLESSSDLNALFKQYPKLRHHLMDIWLAMQPPASPSPDLYSKLTGKQNHQKTWTQDRGLEKGREALQRAREAWGKDGEGVREYGELILRIVEGIDAEELVRRELERENARVVKALLDGEM